MPKLLNIKQVAKLFHVTVRTIENRIRGGKFPPPITPEGSKRLWNETDIEYCMSHRWGDQEKELPETPAQRSRREALEEAECARWGIWSQTSKDRRRFLSVVFARFWDKVLIFMRASGCLNLRSKTRRAYFLEPSTKETSQEEKAWNEIQFHRPRADEQMFYRTAKQKKCTIFQLLYFFNIWKTFEFFPFFRHNAQ